MSNLPLSSHYVSTRNTGCKFEVRNQGRDRELNLIIEEEHINKEISSAVRLDREGEGESWGHVVLYTSWLFEVHDWRGSECCGDHNKSVKIN